MQSIMGEVPVYAAPNRWLLREDIDETTNNNGFLLVSTLVQNQAGPTDERKTYLIFLLAVTIQYYNGS